MFYFTQNVQKNIINIMVLQQKLTIYVRTEIFFHHNSTKLFIIEDLCTRVKEFISFKPF